MLKQENLIINKKQTYLKPECETYELEPESAILSASSGETSVNNADAEINSFLYGRKYDTSVF